MPALYNFLSPFNCLYLRFEDPFLFGQSDSTFEAFTSAGEFARCKTLIIDLSHLTEFKVDVTRCTEKTLKITDRFPARGIQFTVLAPTKESRSLADLLQKLWETIPQLPIHIFDTHGALLEHIGIPSRDWPKLSSNLLGATP